MFLGSCGFEEAGDLDFVEAVMDVFGWGQVPHGGLKRFVAHPVLDCSHVKACPEHAGTTHSATHRLALWRYVR